MRNLLQGTIHAGVDWPVSIAINYAVHRQFSIVLRLNGKHGSINGQSVRH